MGMKFNTNKLQKQLRKASKPFDDHASNAVKEHVDEVFDETQVRVPKKTTALQNTGQVVENQAGKHQASRSIWYGEPGEGEGIVDYAKAVHEILDAEHSPPTGPKFVEQPLIESVGDFKKKTAEEMEKAAKEAFKK